MKAPGKVSSRNVSLQLSISSLLIVLLILLGSSITLYTYESQKKETLKSTADIFKRGAEQTALNLKVLIEPVVNFISLSRQLENVSSSNRQERLELIPYFIQALRNSNWLANVSVGYANGDFVIVWSLRGNKLLSKQTAAPPDAEYLVKIIERNSDEQASERHLFYDEDLTLISEKDRFISHYDPRKRSWYKLAINSDHRIRTEPYRFASTGQVGITTAHQLPNAVGVVAADLALDSLASNLLNHKLTESTQVIIFDEKGTVLAYIDNQRMLDLQSQQPDKNINVSDLKRDELSALYRESQQKNSGQGSVISTEQGEWFSIVTDLSTHPKHHTYLAIATPIRELTANARAMARENLIIAGFVILIAILLGLYVTRRIARSLQILDQQAERIREFDFDTPVHVKSHIKEVASLASTMSLMKSVIQRFIEIARSLSAEQKMERILELILQDAMTVTNADGGSITLLSDDSTKLVYALVRNEETGLHKGGTSQSPADINPVPDYDHDNALAEQHVLKTKSAIVVDDIGVNGAIDFSSVKKHHESGSYVCKSYLALPLLNRQKEVIGVLQLINSRDRQSREITGFSQAYQAYIQALASNAALALDNNRLIRAQKDLFDAFVQLIAGAIDTKSPYTGGHCQRVPVLAELLANAASQSNLDVFKDFCQTEDEKYELHVASWLHDCGKVTTPEYIVDKATKLETLYNRIHEIRMRFEVLWRDAEIAYRDGLASHPGDKDLLRKQLEAHHQQLQDDFAFVASCNAGGEYMDPDHMQRIRDIASQTWERHFDDRLGLSENEAQLRKDVSPVDLPACEQLLADKPEHLIPRIDDGKPFGDNPYGFNMKVPDYAYNLGEVTNLCIAAGTLTDEDRFKINDHIVQTINMLNTLPFPKTLKRVPEWAGNHHEKLDGTGYPRKLKSDDLSIPERVMGIADIFEALTASDRPYKKAKTLSESVRILSFMRNDGHICPDLFDLFLTSGIYLKYAQEHLSPEQIDEVDIKAFVRS